MDQVNTLLQFVTIVGAIYLIYVVIRRLLGHPGPKELYPFARFALVVFALLLVIQLGVFALNHVGQTDTVTSSGPATPVAVGTVTVPALGS